MVQEAVAEVVVPVVVEPFRERVQLDVEVVVPAAVVVTVLGLKITVASIKESVVIRVYCLHLRKWNAAAEEYLVRRTLLAQRDDSVRRRVASVSLIY